MHHPVFPAGVILLAAEDAPKSRGEWCARNYGASECSQLHWTTTLERLPSIEQCGSRERNALPISGTSRSLPRSRDVLSTKKMLLPLLELTRHFLMIIPRVINHYATNNAARSWCGKMKGLDGCEHVIQFLTIVQGLRSQKNMIFSHCTLWQHVISCH